MVEQRVVGRKKIKKTKKRKLYLQKRSNESYLVYKAQQIKFKEIGIGKKQSNSPGGNSEIK